MLPHATSQSCRQVLNIVFSACAAFLLLSASLYGQAVHTPKEPNKQVQKVRSASLPAPGQIQHIVFIMKENRSFDHYFGQYPGANGTTTGVISTGQSIPLWRGPDIMFHDGDHSRWAGLVGEDGGLMDHFDIALEGNENGDYEMYTQMTPADIPNYWAYAQNFVLGDNNYESDLTASWGAHVWSIAATGEQAATVPHTINHKQETSWGCDANSTARITLLDALNVYYDMFPCFDPPTIADSINNSNNSSLSWMFYSPPAPEGGSEHNAFDAVKHIRYSNYWKTNIANSTQFITDALAGNLPSVSWVIAPTAQTEHPPNGTCAGENWTVDQINAIMQGPASQWDSTVVFVTWDEWGGFYDHVYPPQVNNLGLGMRVPLLIVSPYPVQQGHVSHTQYEFASVVKFIEEVFNLPYLTERDANVNDTSDSFDFTQNPLAPVYLQPRACPVASTTLVPYGDVVVKKSRVMKVTVTNYGNTTMSFGKVSTTGDYALAKGGTCGSTLAAGKACTLEVVFTPKAAGLRTGVLTINDSDPSSPQTVNLSGTGTYLNLPIKYPGLSFSTIYLGSNRQQQVQLSNTGSAPVTINQIQTVGAYSETDNCGSSLAKGQSCEITVTFAPIATGYQDGNLIIWDSDPGSPHQGLLQGSGAAFDQQPTSLSFSTPVGQTSQPQSVTVTNTANVLLTIENPTADAPFNQTNNCPTQLGAGAQCTIQVTFSPTQKGQVASRLFINDEDLTSPQIVNLTGTGE